MNVDYPEILRHIADYNVSGRTESASFLIWYLENYYRLSSQEAIDSVCDQRGDKGIDGIYVNDSLNSIDIFQTKISQRIGRTIGDVVLKEFLGTLSQLDSKESLQNLIDNSGNAQVAGLAKRLNLIDKTETYTVRGIFVSNIDIDVNGTNFLSDTPSIEFIGKIDLESTYISNSKEIPENREATFDISGISIASYYVNPQTKAIIAPIKSTELVQMEGISDQSVFAYNVRGPLGRTNVNKDIVKSIKNPETHKQFPLFHNGITVVTNEILESEDKLTVKTFYVVNGCQSLTALYTNRNLITEDLRILTKFVQVGVDSPLAEIITNYSNNQNGVKARDFKSNSSVQVRLQNEFKKLYDDYFFEVKRGEDNKALETISNEQAGINLMAFDLREPWGTHRRYQVFDEKYNDIFTRPEVTAHRIVLTHILEQRVKEKLSEINNQLVSKYALTRAIILYVIRQILENDTEGKKLLINPENYVSDKGTRTKFIKCADLIIDDIIVDLNGEVDQYGEDFDYKSNLRDKDWVNDLSSSIVTSYLKLVNRGRINSFEQEWSAE